MSNNSLVSMAKIKFLKKILMALGTVVLISACSPSSNDEITAESLIKEQQTLIKNAMSSKNIHSIKAGRYMLTPSYFNFEVDGVEGKAQFSADINALHMDDCDNIAVIELKADGDTKSGLSLSLGLDKSCVNSQSLTNYFLYIIDTSSASYQEAITLKHKPENNRKSFKND